MSLAESRMPSMAALPHSKYCTCTTRGAAPQVGDWMPAADAFPYARLPRYTGELIPKTLRDVTTLEGDVVGVARELSLPLDFQRYESKNKRFQLRSWAWQVTLDELPLCDVRVVYISGTKNTIINTWVFPYAPRLQPVFAAELIALGDHPKLTFMDIQGPCLDMARQVVVRRATERVASRFADLRIAEQPPAWAIDASLGQYMFTRDLPCEMASRVAEGYELLFAAYLNLITRPIVACDGDDSRREELSNGLAELHRYQLHHLESSPGKVFLSKLFGEQWTESFLNDFLFCLPGELA